MVWGRMSAAGVGELVIIKTNTDGKLYVQILKKILKRVLKVLVFLKNLCFIRVTILSIKKKM